MTRILYIGSPTSIHDLKWSGYFSARPDFEVFIIGHEEEVHRMETADHQRLQELNITLETPIRSYSLWRWWDNRHSADVIRRVVRQREIDVFHVLFATPFAIWTRYVDIPSIITCRGSDVQVVLPELLTRKGIARIHGRWVFQQFSKAFAQADAITCTSSGQLDRARQLFGEHINADIIRTGVDVNTIAETDAELPLPEHFAGRLVIFLPRYIRPIYRTDLQLEAMALLPEPLKEKVAVLMVKGKGKETDYQRSMVTMAATIGVPFHVVDSFTQPEMWTAYNRSALTIMTPRTDGTPNSALEAMAARCPLILGSFAYDMDLFSERFCLRMKTDSPSELAVLITEALNGYPEGMTDGAFKNVRERGNRPVEMERLRELYGRLTVQ